MICRVLIVAGAFGLAAALPACGQEKSTQAKETPKPHETKKTPTTEKRAANEKPQKQEASMTARLPKVGTAVPDFEIYQADGKSFATGNLKGQYTVLVFGCLT